VVVNAAPAHWQRTVIPICSLHVDTNNLPWLDDEGALGKIIRSKDSMSRLGRYRFAQYGSGPVCGGFMRSVLLEADRKGPVQVPWSPDVIWALTY